jgi:hypothetical protein
MGVAARAHPSLICDANHRSGIGICIRGTQIVAVTSFGYSCICSLPGPKEFLEQR